MAALLSLSSQKTEQKEVVFFFFELRGTGPSIFKSGPVDEACTVIGELEWLLH